MERTERDVIISISGNKQDENGTDEEIGFVTEGVYSRRGAVHTLRYSERDEESGESLPTRIEVEGGRVTVTSGRDDVTQMEFSRGRRFASSVGIQDGPVEMGVFPTAVDVLMRDDEGCVDLRYQMDVDGLVTGMNHVTLSYKARAALK